MLRNSYARHRERRRADNRRWEARNPGNHELRNGRRRAAIKTNACLVTEQDWQRLCRRYRGECAYCHTPTPDPEMDHVIPISRGGRHCIGNLLPACRACNRSKQSKFVTEWRLQSRARRAKKTP